MKRATVPMITLFALAVMTLLSVSDSPAGSDLRTIDTAQLHSMAVDNAYRLEAGREKQYTIIDVRPEQEYAEAHIFSAISIPENSFERSTDLLPKDKATLLVVYADDAGSPAIRKWAAKAASLGYTNLAVYAEGFPAWKEKKMPVVLLRNGR